MAKEITLLKCANFMNQEAINDALSKANENLSRLGDTKETLYKLGTNCCAECDYGLGIETSPVMSHLKMMAGHPIKRVCYKGPERR